MIVDMHMIMIWGMIDEESVAASEETYDWNMYILMMMDW